MTQDANAQRPDPDALLLRVNAEEERSRRARLKVFFGFAPGVGKTYAMLQSAQSLRAEGVDVVVGCVETHGRAETEELLDGLELVPRLAVPYRGMMLGELDLERILRRQPEVVLVDELAHSNPRGLRHAKRWQDVLDLLDAGIAVHTTLNVQHVESLNDVVAQITQVRVRETVPDAMLDRADEVALIDLPPEVLLARLEDGKVYLPDQARRASMHFFHRGNLLALRELALRVTADHVDEDVRAYRETHSIRATWPTAERLLVYVEASAASGRVVRAARRMAAGVRAPWVAAWSEALVKPMRDADRERLEAHLRLAESLGAEPVRLGGVRTASAILEYARHHNVTRIIVGKPPRGGLVARLVDLFRGSMHDELVRGSGDIDVHVISGDAEEGELAAPDPAHELATPWANYAASAGLVVAAGLVAAIGRNTFAAPDRVTMFLAAIMLAAARIGRGPALFAAGLSVAVYDFFFVEPHYTFAVADARHSLTFAMMFGVGVLISSLTERIRRQEEAARAREERTAALYTLSRELAGAVDATAVAKALAGQVGSVFRAGTAVLLQGPDQQLSAAAEVGELLLDTQEWGVLRWVRDHARPAGLGTTTLPGARITGIPLLSGAAVIGVLALAPHDGRRSRLDDRQLLDAFARQGALALERAALAEDARASSLRARTEELRSALLSTVSHDLRTPLATITGAATTLRDDRNALPDAVQRELLATVCEEAERLERLVGNLLDMTRLESGAMHPKREWVPVEEIVGSALGRLEQRLQGRELRVDLDAALPLISVDPLLLEQFLINLIENSAKYSAPESPVEIVGRLAKTDERVLSLEVRDRGPGLPEDDIARIFEKFYRGANAGQGGAGLGLSICRAIVESHGGTLVAQNREGGGAVFRALLPLTGDAPATELPVIHLRSAAELAS